MSITSRLWTIIIYDIFVYSKLTLECHFWLQICFMLLQQSSDQWWKQGLRRTRKLRQCTNWKVNLRICELAKASSKENWSVQLIHPAGPSSWSVQLVRPAGPSSRSVQQVRPTYFKKSLKTKSKESLSHRLKNLFKHVARCTCFQVHMLPIAHIANCPCCKLHVM